MGRISLLFILYGASIAVFAPFASVILAGRGFDRASIGALSAVTSVAFVVSVSAWGHLGDAVLGRARALRYAILGAAGLLAVFLLPVPAGVSAVAYVAYAACYGAVGPLSDALAVNAMRDPGRQYGRVRGYLSAGFAVTAVTVGLLYGQVGYGPAGFFFVALASTIAVLAGRLPDLGRARLNAHRRGGAIREALHVQPKLSRALVAIAVAHVGIFAGLTFLPLRILEVGGGPPQVAFSSATSATVEILAMIAAGRLAGRLGIRTLFGLSCVGLAVVTATWGLVDSSIAIIATRILSGLAYSGLWISSVLTVQVLLPARLQGSGQALISITTAGAAAFLANLAGGVLYATAGAGVLFGVAALFPVAGGLVGWWVLPHRLPERVAAETEGSDAAPAVPEPAAAAR
jgi:MFS family permease